MLFSGGSAPAKARIDEKPERKVKNQERNELREAVFTRWANSLFETETVNELQDIVELNFLQSLCRLLTGEKAPISGNRFDDIDAVFHALASGEDDKILSLSIPELCDGNPKALHSLCWQLIQIFWSHNAPHDGGERRLAEAIKDWCLEAVRNYSEVVVNDFTSSWRDGIALNLLLHSYDRTLVDMDRVRELRGDERIENALSVAKKRFKVPKLLQSRDFQSDQLDSKAMVTYLMTLYLSLAHHSNVSLMKSSMKKSTHSNPEAEAVPKRGLLEAPSHRGNTLEEFGESPNTSSIQSSTHSSAPSSSTVVTVINTGLDSGVPRQQSSETLSDTNADIESDRRRNSSSSSQLSSSKSQKSSQRNERLLKEYELCLEQVLTWLLEAEEELRKMEPINDTDLETVKHQLKEHEQFMLQLTSSQGSVGRVLHAGQNLSQKLPEEQSIRITDQLNVVNQRWDEIREKAMIRQRALHERLVRLQKKQLDAVDEWISQFEKLKEEQPKLADTVEECRQQILAHNRIQEKIDDAQSDIRKLSSFVAVVDDQSADKSSTDLEKTLAKVSKRWVSVCEWAEQRAQKLDGLMQLIENYESLYTHLSAWLSARQEELSSFRSAHHLENEEEIEDQKKLIQSMDGLLETEHPSFVQLSQFSTDLVHRFGNQNEQAAETIKKQFQSITEQWDNIVNRLEEHSKMLNSQGSANEPIDTPKTSTATKVTKKRSKADFQSSIKSDTPIDSSDLESRKPSNVDSLITEFTETVKQLARDIEPVSEFVRNFKIPTKEQFAEVETEFKSNFQTVLMIKSKVEELNVQLERIHENSGNSGKLRLVNDSFDRFMQMYGSVVSRFTEIIQFIQNPELATDETAKVERRLHDWIKAANAVWEELSRIEPNERGRRLEDFAHQLNIQQKNLSDLKQSHQNAERFRPLEGQLIELMQKVRREREKEKPKPSIRIIEESAHEETPKPEEEPRGSSPQRLGAADPDDILLWLRQKEFELKRNETVAGDLENLKNDEFALTKLLEEVSLRRREVREPDDAKAADMFKKALELKRNDLAEGIRRTETALLRFVQSEEVADDIRRKLSDLETQNVALSDLFRQITTLNDHFLSKFPLRSEAINLLEEIIAAASKSNGSADRRDFVIKGFVERIQKLNSQWKQLETDLDEYKSLVTRELRKHIRTLIQTENQTVEELRGAIVSSGEATDAEELSENVDNLERLLDKLKEADPFQSFRITDLPDTLLLAEIDKLSTQRSQIIQSGRERVSQLQKAIQKCEKYETALCSLQNWHQTVIQIFDLEIPDDVDSLEISDSYKLAASNGSLDQIIDSEFAQFEGLLVELEQFIEDSRSNFASCDRLCLQLEHSRSLLAEVAQKRDAFRRPIQYSKRIENVETELNEIESSISDLSNIRSENVEYCLDHSETLSKRLETLQSTIDDLNETKDQMIRLGVLSELQTLEFGRRLEDCEEKCSAISSAVYDIHGKLEKDSELLTELNAELNRIDKLEGNQKSATLERAAELIDHLAEDGIRVDSLPLDSIRQKIATEKSKPQKEEFNISKIKEIVEKLEKSKFVESLLSGLQKHSAAIDGFADRIIGIIEKEETIDPKVVDLAVRLAKLKRRALTATDLIVPQQNFSLSQPNPLISIENLDFEDIGNCVGKCLEWAQNLDSNLDFEKFPVKDKTEWKQRIQMAKTSEMESVLVIENLMAEGRRLAQSGPMELENHETLNAFDEISELSAKNRTEIDRQTQQILEVEDFEETIKQRYDSVSNELERISAIPFETPKISAKNHLELVRLEIRMIEVNIGATKIRDRLIGRETALNHSAELITELSARLCDLTERTLSSLFPIEELSKSEKEETTEEEPTEPNPNSIHSLYEYLDSMEEKMERQSPMSESLLNEMDSQLDVGERLIADNQMTLAINEAEHSFSRIANLRKIISNRREELDKKGANDLSNLIDEAERSVERIGIQSAQKPTSPEEQSQTEGLLAPTAVLLQVSLHFPENYFQQCENRLSAIIPELNEEEAEYLQKRIANLETNFKIFGNSVRENRKLLDNQLIEPDRLTEQLNKIEQWHSQNEIKEKFKFSFLDPKALETSLSHLNNLLAEVEKKIESLRELETLKDRFVSIGTADSETKHKIRRQMTTLEKRISDFHLELTQQLKVAAETKEISEDFWKEIAELEKWVQEAKKQTATVRHAKLYQPLLINLQAILDESSDRRFLLDSLQRQTAEEALDCDPLEEEHRHNIKKIDDLSREFNETMNSVRSILRSSVAESAGESKKMTESVSKPESEISVENGTLTTESAEEFASSVAVLHEMMQPLGVGDFSAPLSPREQNDVGDFQIRLSNGEEQIRLDTIRRIRSRLQEIEREAALTVDFSDQNAIRQIGSKMQNWIDELISRRMEVLRIVDMTEEPIVSERGSQCFEDLETLLASCQRRKAELAEMLHQSKVWDQLRSEMELWLGDGLNRLEGSDKVNEMDEEALSVELLAVNSLVADLEPMKAKMSSLNAQSNRVLDLFVRDDSHNFSHLTSKVNIQWTKFNDSVRIRRAVLEATLKARNDVQSTMVQLNDWMEKQLGEIKKLHSETENRQRLKDTTKRRDWMAAEREIKAEVDAHRDVMNSVREMSRKLLMGLEENKERNKIREEIEQLETKWNQLNTLDGTVRERLDGAQEECERLTRTLADLLHWTDMQISTLLGDQPVGGDLDSIERQNRTVKQIEQQFDTKDRQVSECIQLAHSYLMQHDLRPMMHRQSVLEPMDLISRSETELEERRVGVQILADSEKLKTSYDQLKQHVSTWERVVANAHADISKLDRAIAESLLAIGTIENELENRKPVEELRLEQLKDARTENLGLKRRVQTAGVNLDDVNDCAGQIAAQNITLSANMEAQIQLVNERFEKLKKEVAIRGAALERAFTDFGPLSEHFLLNSVSPPWQRAISAVNQLPYYIDHNSENTQWDHPAMVNVLEKLSVFNQIKFSAYRTAMKLRALQKHLLLDLIDLVAVDETLKRFGSFKLEDRARIEDVVLCLVPLFEDVHSRYPDLVQNVSLAVDLALNLLLNIYDPCRDGKMRVVSLAIALVVLCNANLDTKYKYLFSLITDDEGVTPKKLGVLFYDLIHIPKFLGESAVFGGSNVEPAVRSCFESNKYPETLGIDGYLEWLQKEPQNLIWLPVLHRFQSSEFAKHQSKCSTCKMFPIIGMRYRCLRCFNFDICQNCFFSQRTARNHKLTHPMQEYCLPTKTIDDFRDFTLIFKNKLRHTKAEQLKGYLPVETVIEGAPMERGQSAPQNPNSETIHHRMHTFSLNLNRHRTDIEKRNPPLKEETKADRKSPSPSVDHQRQKSSEVKSPSQLILQVEQMHKEELNQLLQKLQQENGELKQAIDRKRRLGSTPNLDFGRLKHSESSLPHRQTEPNFASSSRTMPRMEKAMSTVEPPKRWPSASFRPNSQPELCSPEDRHRLYGKSVPTLPRAMDPQAMEQQRLLDALSLRNQQKHLEERGRVLEEQNRQLQVQLERLQTMVHNQNRQKPQTWEQPAQLTELHSLQPLSSADEDDFPGGIEGLQMRRHRMDALMNTVNELNRAVESFVVSVVNNPDGGEA